MAVTMAAEPTWRASVDAVSPIAGPRVADQGAELKTSTVRSATTTALDESA